MEFQKLQRIIADVLNISEDKITKESAFVDDLKADSLDVFQIITEIEDQFGIQIPDDAIENIVTVGDAATQINSYYTFNLQSGVNLIIMSNLFKKENTVR